MKTETQNMLKKARMIAILVIAICGLSIGLLAITGYSFGVARLHQLGGTNLSLPGATLLTAVFVVLLLIGTMGLGKPPSLLVRLMEGLVTELTHPHQRYLKTDELLREMMETPNTQSPENRDKLKTLLEARAVDMDPEISDAERQSAKLMLKIMDFALEEKKRVHPFYVTFERCGAENREEDYGTTTCVLFTASGFSARRAWTVKEKETHQGADRLAGIPSREDALALSARFKGSRNSERQQTAERDGRHDHDRGSES